MRSSISLSLLLLVFSVIGCEEPFSPKVALNDEYVLQCFVEGDFGRVVTPVNLLLAKVYDVEGLNPWLNTNDPSVLGAEVSFSINEKAYSLAMAVRPSKDSTRYGPEERYYVARIPKPEPYNVLTVVAKLPTGKVLRAQTTVPKARAFNSSYPFARGITTGVNLPPGTRDWTIDWEDYEPTEGHLFFPRLMIGYTKSVGDAEQGYTITVPARYIQSKDGPVPVYHTYSTQKFCSFDFPAIDSAMASISADDPKKISYAVSSALLEVIEFDAPLSKYFSSMGGSLDPFSIRVNQTVYSNINGGTGIFGSYFTNKAYFDFNPDYVRSFGYRYR
ncbi:MAG: DUF4249 family protein [Ignavibacteriales bacterium]|nr:DUF4249 family protein [Ignavibacteriales bacterium]